MVKVFLELLSLIDMSKSVPEGRWAESIVWIIVFSELHVKCSHEEFVLKSHKSIWIFLLHDVKQLELFSNTVINESGISMDGVVKEVGASLDEILNREKGFISELFAGGANTI